VLFCGERESLRIEGFDLDNSPASFAAPIVAGKTLVMTTTNGTRALRAVAAATSVRAAALVNRSAVADALAQEDGDVVIVCAGEANGFALEDALGAGALVDALLMQIGTVELTDGARAAALLYRAVAGRLADAVASADHAQVLAHKGFAGDVTRCAALDSLDVVPTLRDGILVSSRNGS
jgi:2-phosphosulfolactate phosphatase